MSSEDFEVIIREIVALPSYKDVMEKHLSAMSRAKTVDEVARMEAARLTGLMEPTPSVLRSLGRLLTDPSPDVLNYALDSAAIHLQKEQVPLIIPLLGNPTTKQAAQVALVAFGSRVADTLTRHLQNTAERVDVRKAIPEVLARLGRQKAADILVAQLSLGEDALEQELVEALRIVRQSGPDVQFKAAKISAAVLSLIG